MSDLKAEGLIRNAFKRSLKRFTSMLSIVLERSESNTKDTFSMLSSLLRAKREGLRRILFISE